MILDDNGYVLETLWNWVLFNEGQGPMPANVVTWHANKLYWKDRL